MAKKRRGVRPADGPRPVRARAATAAPQVNEVPPVPGLRELVDSFLDIRLPETGALLTVLAELVPDDVLARRIRRALEARDDALPDWLTGLASLTVVRAVETGHVLGDGGNIALDVRTGTGAPLGVMVYVGHNLGTVVKDKKSPRAGNGHRVLDRLFDQPIVTVATVRDLLGVTHAGANNLVKRLAALDILREFTGYARHRRYRFEPYLRLFEQEAP